MSEKTEEEMHLFVHLLAMGALLEMTMAKLFSMAPDPAQEADAWVRRVDAIGSRMTFPDAGPAWSDHAAQTYRDTLVRHVLRAKAQATGQPYDPEKY